MFFYLDSVIFFWENTLGLHIIEPDYFATSTVNPSYATDHY